MMINTIAIYSDVGQDFLRNSSITAIASCYGPIQPFLAVLPFCYSLVQFNLSVTYSLATPRPSCCLAVCSDVTAIYHTVKSSDQAATNAAVRFTCCMRSAPNSCSG